MADLSEYVLLNSLFDLANAQVDAAQSKELAYHKKHLQALWRHVQRLESALDISKGETTLKCANASITLKVDGSIILKGRNLKIEGYGSVEIKAGSNVVIKGEKILEN